MKSFPELIKGVVDSELAETIGRELDHLAGRALMFYPTRYQLSTDSNIFDSVLTVNPGFSFSYLEADLLTPSDHIILFTMLTRPVLRKGEKELSEFEQDLYDKGFALNTWESAHDSIAIYYDDGEFAIRLNDIELQQAEREYISSIRAGTLPELKMKMAENSFALDMIKELGGVR